jgi:hypothetical protein
MLATLSTFHGHGFRMVIVQEVRFDCKAGGGKVS